MSDAPNPFELLGGEATVLNVVRDFYAIMAEKEPALARTHVCDEAGRVSPEAVERFGLFFIGWLGGPQVYMERHGHPRLRMRHARVAVDTAMRNAWLRCMFEAFDRNHVAGPVRAFLEHRLFEVADFLRNTEDEA